MIHPYETGASRLFNIASDLGERHDLAQEMPTKAKELDKRLTDYLEAINAQMPIPNPNYDPSKRTEVDRGGKRKGKQ